MKPRSSKLLSLAPMLLALLALRTPALAEDPSNRSGVTLMVFGQHPIADGFWSVLADSLRRESTWESRSAPIDANPSIVLGGLWTPAPELPERIEIELLGRCDLPGQIEPGQGPLGWVLMDQGKIEPFIRVNCARVMQYLDPTIRSMPKQRRMQIVADAVSRIILHEWIHIATQSATHSRDGVMQSALTIHDLIAPIPVESGQSSPQVAEARKGPSRHKHGNHCALESALGNAPIAGATH